MIPSVIPSYITPNSQGQYRVNYKNRIHICEIKTIEEVELFLLRNSKNQVFYELTDTTTITFHSHFKK